MKRNLFALLLVLALLSVLTGALATGPNGTLAIQLCRWSDQTYMPAEADRVELTLNGAALEGDVPAMVQGGRTLVPVRLVGEALAAQVLWVQETGQVIRRKGSDVIVLTLDSGTALVNGTEETLPDGVPAQVVRYEGSDRTMVPLRFVSERLGAEVAWEQETYTASLTAELPEEVPPESSEPPVETPDPEEGQGQEEHPDDLVRPEGRVTAVQADALSQSVAILTDRVLEYRITDLGDRVAVDLLGALLDGAPQGEIIVAGERLAEVRYAQHGPEFYSGYDHTVRVVLDLQPGASYGENIQVEARPDGLYLTLSRPNGETAFVPTAPLQPETFTVVIDPGHGGDRPGAHYEGVDEKDIDLSVSLKLEALLKGLGYQVVMTRSTDVEIGLYERADLANAAEADLFVSIHSNAAEDRPDYQGIYTYYHPTSSRGARLAQAIQTPLCQITGGIDRGIRSADFVVLRETDMCAVLVEMGFMSSPEELDRLLDDAYQDKLAQGIAQGIVRYLNAMA